MLRTNIKLHNTYQHFIQESTKLFYSKLDFLGWNCAISPVKALIVFSHTDLSLFCLKALQQSQKIYMGSFLFFRGMLQWYNRFI